MCPVLSYNAEMDTLTIVNTKQQQISEDETVHRINKRLKKTVPMQIIAELTDPEWLTMMNDLRKDYSLQKKLHIKKSINRRLMNVPPMTAFWITENFGNDVWTDKKELKKVLKLDPLLESVLIVPMAEL